MRLILLAAALTASAGVAFADQPARVAPSADSGIRQVFLCERSPEMGGSWVRQCAGRTAASDGVVRPTSTATRVARQVYVCDRTAETRRSWVREYGSMTFVTAEELAQAEASNEAWAAPRCMTNAEMRRFTRDAPEGAKTARAINVATGF